MEAANELNFYIWLGFRVFFICLLFVFLLSGLDDLFLDLVYYVRMIYRKLFLRNRIKPLTVEQLGSVSEQPIAIMIPAWDESAVVGKMLLNTLNTIDYKNYYFFVGTYPNDEATALEAERIREIYPNIEIAVTPADGPTNKADCLNWIYQGILVFEKENDMHFEVFMMHDAEDIIHPISLKYVNYLIPRMDFIQLPVFPLETPWYHFVAGVYKDEFAETHSKDLRAREVLADAIPSAGVGTALSRKAVEFMAENRKNQIFDIQSLTEDYLLGMRLQDLDGRKIFLQQALERKIKVKSRWTGREVEKTIKDPVATRELFPDSFKAATRQKARWILGIAIQGWDAGWTRSIGTNYCLYRDRKSILTNLIVMLGYFAVLFWTATWGINKATGEAKFPPLIEADEVFFYCMWIVVALLLWRFFNRVLSTWRLYGPLDGIMAIPRFFVGNVVNFFATVQAIQRYISSRRSGTVPEWGKTDHAWPSELQLRTFHKKLGDLLLERRLISAEQLIAALDRQKETGERLGEILVKMGSLWDEDLAFVLARQKNREAVEIDPFGRPDLLDIVDRDTAEKYSVFPVDKEESTLILAATVLDQPDVEEALAKQTRYKISLRLASEVDIDYAIRRAYSEKAHLPFSLQHRLGQRLVSEGKITEEDLKEALRRQKRAHQRLGEILVEMNLISEQELKAQLEKQ
ncbi:MAG: glycosyl transferase family protein [Verrucomicrobia bacterium]|nr:glycosyl transferase family protein [Verrucomicrobiota bacterium]